MRWLAGSLLVVSGFLWADEPVLEVHATANDCSEPEMTFIPDGSDASSQDMLEVQAKVELHIADTKDYLNCLLSVEKTIGDALTYDQKKDSISRYNLAIARMEGVVDSYNQQLKSYQRVNAK